MNMLTRGIVSRIVLRTSFKFLSSGKGNTVSCSSKSIWPKTQVQVEKLSNNPHKFMPLSGTPISEDAFGQPTHFSHPHELQEGEVTPGIRVEEYRARRHRLNESILSFASRHQIITKSHVVVIPASCKKYMTEKIPYVFRQNSDFMYLTGCLEQDSVLVQTIINNNEESILFLRGKNPHSEMWDGPRTGMEQGQVLFGVERCMPLAELNPFLTSFIDEKAGCMLWYDYLNDIQPAVHGFMKEFLAQAWSKRWESPKSLIHRLRLFKSPAEQSLMQKSCDIAGEAIRGTMAASVPGQSEAELFARVDYLCRLGGAQYLAYPPVVAGGSRANIIHYINNNQVVEDGEMVLMDAGCEYNGYCSDITRVWPMTGRFSAAQRTLYEAVLSVQLDTIKACGAFPSLDRLYDGMCRLLGTRLREAGVLNKLAGTSQVELARAAHAFCPHHVSHYLGMDVHDVASVPRNLPLEPGMVITVEPGAYVNATNRLANPEFHGIGIRIEDDILITNSGPVVLSRNCPKQPDDIEAVIASSSCKYLISHFLPLSMDNHVETDTLPQNQNNLSIRHLFSIMIEGKEQGN